jgi:hypothetical protein
LIHWTWLVPAFVVGAFAPAVVLLAIALSNDEPDQIEIHSPEV